MDGLSICILILTILALSLLSDNDLFKSGWN